jgi:hypothetical protein
VLDANELDGGSPDLQDLGSAILHHLLLLHWSLAASLSPAFTGPIQINPVLQDLHINLHKPTDFRPLKAPVLSIVLKQHPIIVAEHL